MPSYKTRLAPNKYKFKAAECAATATFVGHQDGVWEVEKTRERERGGVFVDGLSVSVC